MRLYSEKYIKIRNKSQNIKIQKIKKMWCFNYCLIEKSKNANFITQKKDVGQ